MHRKEIEGYEKEKFRSLRLMKRPRLSWSRIFPISDFSQFKPMRFEFKPKEKSLNLRISEDLLDAVRENAKREGIPYQRYIRQALEWAVTARKR